MAWKGKAAPQYHRRRKKLPPEVRRAINDVQAKILQDPYVGDRKRGALKDVWVEKFKAQNDQYLVAYQIDNKGEMVMFLDIGQHENFYRDLERYLSKRVKTEPSDLEQGKTSEPSYFSAWAASRV